MNGIPVATAVVAGLVHALEADHVAAVTTFVARRPHPLRALRFGVQWGLGHSAALLFLGGFVALLGLELPDSLVTGMEAGVGAMLMALGVWAASGGRPRGARALAYDADDQAERPHEHRSWRGTAWVGAAHGLAGAAGFVAIVPALLLSSAWSAGGYLILFAAGTVLAMGAYALVAGFVFVRAGSSMPRAAKAIRILAGGTSIAIGIAWIARAFG